MQANRRKFLCLALMGAMLCWAPGVVTGEDAAGPELAHLTLAVPGMT